MSKDEPRQPKIRNSLRTEMQDTRNEEHHYHESRYKFSTIIASSKATTVELLALTARCTRQNALHFARSCTNGTHADSERCSADREREVRMRTTFNRIGRLATSSQTAASTFAHTLTARQRGGSAGRHETSKAIKPRMNNPPLLFGRETALKAVEGLTFGLEENNNVKETLPCLRLKPEP